MLTLKMLKTVTGFKREIVLQKVIIKVSKRKDTYKIRQGKKKIEIVESMGISSPSFINDGLCAYYKKLWPRCKKF